MDIVFGMLNLSSKQIYTIGKKDMVMKKFTPYLNNKIQILAKTKKLNDMIDVMCIIKLEFDEKNNRYIGTVLEYIYDVKNKIPHYLGSCHWKKINKIIPKYLECDLTPEREIIDGEIFSIDPIGCVDIDDAIEYKNIDSAHIFRIHITDVSSYIPEDSDLDIEISRRCETIYLEDETIHMIPEELSLKKCSLTQGTIRRCYTATFVFSNLHSFELISYSFKKTNINVTRNLSYEEAQKIIDTKKNNNLTILFEFGKILHKYYKNDNKYDTHSMIANYMILTNNYVGKEMKTKSNGILRKHSSDMIRLTYNNEINYSIYEKYKNAHTKSAEYVLSSDSDDTYHKGLNLDTYTHFTSPMRRYADILVHRILSSTLPASDAEHGTISLDNNLKDKVIRMNHFKKLYNECQTISKLDKFFREKNINDYECESSVVGLSEKFVKVYSENIDNIFTVNIINDKLEIIRKSKIYDNSLCITNSKNELIYKINMFDKVKIKIFRNIKNMKQYSVTIIEPDLQIYLFDL
jgi:exoribonuclease R